ncbi:MAG: MotA/TolQ/ExbB proton channel family protein [Gemmataceae bacterium]|nr:MotA/TolQ/ExbB proton channel family protein [Gemmataceae bacterium]MDW8265390.1 MotA/TolQ/ExbB proton channel family protein [Gemmataceae bacterium]
MTRSQPSLRHEPTIRVRRSRAIPLGMILGLPLAAGFLYLVRLGPWQGHPLARYVHHPVECAEVVMFGVGLGVLLSKLGGWLWERAACRRPLVPPWDGRTVPVGQAGQMLADLERQPAWMRNTFAGCRVANVLDFLRSRGSAADLDDQLRALADADALALESSYSLTRFITWAIPILGFLGTVLGITGAIAGVTPEKLEHDLNSVTDGLALAFDATALALGLTMVLMFVSFLVERAEQGVLETVDRLVEQQLAHRFERTGTEGGAVVEAVRQQTQVVVSATEELVRRQAAVWAQALQEVDRRRSELEERQQRSLTKSLELALDQTLEAHSRRLAGLERVVVEGSGQLCDRLAALAQTIREQSAAQAEIAQKLAQQTEVLARLQESERQLLRLEEQIQHNLAALAHAGSFEDTLHSLTAAVHLLTARVSEGGPRLSIHRPAAKEAA